MISQQEIATQLNISQAAVSKVINNPDCNSVSKIKRQKIQALVNKNDYQLTKRKTKQTVCFLLHDFSHFDEYCYNRYLTGAEEAAKANGFELTVHNWREDADFVSSIPTLAGIVLTRQIPLKSLKALQAKAWVVSLNYQQKENVCDMIMQDNYSGISTMVKHLHKLGHRRIAWFSPLPANTMANFDSRNHLERYSGYFQGLTECGMKLDEELVLNIPLGKYAGKDFYYLGQLEKLMKLKKPPTAIICFNDLTAVSIMGDANRLGLRVPDDLCVAGFDNFSISELCHPKLTTIDVNMLEAGKQAIQLLERRINNPHCDNTYVSVRVEPSLVTRESVCSI
jgi:LacI family transcriptional regulator, galactose operon repressor